MRRNAYLMVPILALVLNGALGAEEPTKPELPTVIYDEPSPNVKRALERVVTLELNDSPLTEFVGFIREFTEQNVVLDLKGLEIAGVDKNESVTLSLNDVVLKDVLDLLLSPLELTYLVKGDCIVITDAEETGAEPETRIYPVVDLVTVQGSSSVDAMVLAHRDMIQQTVEPDSWEENGGVGTIAFVPSTFCFVVRTTQKYHEEVARTLKLIRAARGPTEAYATQAQINLNDIRTLYKYPRAASEEDDDDEEEEGEDKDSKKEGEDNTKETREDK